MIEILSGRLQRRKDCSANIAAGVVALDRLSGILPVSASLIGWPRQPPSVARRTGLSRQCDTRGQHSFKPAHPIAKISDLLAEPPQIDCGDADTLVKEDDLAQRPDRVAIEAHAAAGSFRRRLAGSRFDCPVKILRTLR